MVGDPFESEATALTLAFGAAEVAHRKANTTDDATAIAAATETRAMLEVRLGELRAHVAEWHALADEMRDVRLRLESAERMGDCAEVERLRLTGAALHEAAARFFVRVRSRIG